MHKKSATDLFSTSSMSNNLASRASLANTFSLTNGQQDNHTLLSEKDTSFFNKINVCKK